MSQWQPVDWIVLILAASLAVALLMTVAGPILLNKPITNTRAKLLNAVVGALLGVIATYVGLKAE